MVAVSSVVFFTDVCAEGLHTTIFLIFFEQERCIEDETVVQSDVDVLADKYVVEATPFALVFVGATCSVPAFCIA